MGRIEHALAEQGITLPAPSGAVANYLPVRLAGNLAFVSGQIPLSEGQLCASGPVPSTITPQAAKAAARQCVINALAALQEALGGELDRIEGIVRLGVFVASDRDFHGQSAVADAASELLVTLWGDAGRHARAAVGCMALPLGATVEVELVVAISR